MKRFVESIFQSINESEKRVMDMSVSRGLVFHRLLEQTVVIGPVTDADITHGYQ
jgi:hypothetical protein